MSSVSCSVPERTTAIPLRRLLAKKAGLHRVYVAQIEGQTKVPSLATLEKLAKALRVKVTKLLE